MRTCKAERRTSETYVSVGMNLDGTGEYSIDTGMTFFDHMLEQLAKHSGIDLTVGLEDGLFYDEHHAAEDTGIVIGEAFAECLGDKAGIERYGSSLLPMDDALVQTAVDFCGRSYLAFNVTFPSERTSDFELENIREFFRAVADSAKMNIHITSLAGENSHHIAEAVFKSFAKAVKTAVRFSGDSGILSTKGTL